jgi:hypothetical protein
MQEMTQDWPASPGPPDELLRSLAHRITLVHILTVREKPRLILRFDNGYGVSLLLEAVEENGEVFEMQVLKFHGAGIKDHKLAQYTRIPEFNRDNFEEIAGLCRQVSLLPPKEVPGTEGFNQSEDREKRGSLLLRSCSPSPAPTVST